MFRSLQLLLVVVSVMLQGCATVDFEQPKTASFAVPINRQAPLVAKADKVVPIAQASAFYPMPEGDEALAMRLALIEQATESLDLQYFLMKGDVTGYLVTHRLLAAADRGVKIRFLLDDVFTTVKDSKLFLLDQHPNIEVRLFNPVSRRGFKYINFLGDFKRANRRMHNKSFTADGVFTIVGGRNIADEYFALTEKSEFFDFDVVAVGEIAGQVSASFDDFWNFQKSIPITQIKAQPNDDELKAERQRVEDNYEVVGKAVFNRMLKHRLTQSFNDNAIPFVIAPAQVVYDSPEKLAREISIENMDMFNSLAQLIKSAEEQVVLVTPYFIPTKGSGASEALESNNVDVILLTNSLASTNHVTVHAHYSKYREEMLRMGIRLFEGRPDAAQLLDEDSIAETSTMHTKLIVVDGRYVFVGSPNLDPRSLEINSEMGIVIDSPEFAEALLGAEADADLLDHMLYRLELNEGKIQWVALENGEEVIYHSEPQASRGRRLQSWFYRIFPEGQM